MSERDRQLEQTVDTDVDDLELDTALDTDSSLDLDSETVRDRSSGPAPAARENDGIGARVKRRFAALATTRELIAAFVTTILGLVVVGGLLPIPAVGNLIGVFAGGFVYGLVAGDSPYLQLAVAGGLATAAWTVLGNLTVALLGSGVTIATAGLVGGLIAAVAGGYFGRDLRQGLTQDVGGDSGPGPDSRR
jgi:hypothetical protein